MSYEQEFQTVDLLLASGCETRAVDAFAISLIKVERQMRRIFTYLIFQDNDFGAGDSAKLRDILCSKRNIYLRHILDGINLIYSKSVSEVYGNGFDEDRQKIEGLVKHRNKIFHGQLTNDRLTREQLEDCIGIIKRWCYRNSDAFQVEIGFDGFARNSYRKAANPLILKNNHLFNTIDKYSLFLDSLTKS